MAPSVREDNEVSISTTDAAPTHFSFKIQSVSLLKQYPIEKYTSALFEAGGYKWKLIFYPNGNKTKHGANHISMHLAVAETCCFQPGWEIHAVFRLFLLDQYKDSFLVIRDAQEKGRRFRATKREWGFDRVVNLETFYDTSNGYVVDDVCVFGAEVYVHKELRFPVEEPKFPKGECLSMAKDPDPAKLSWPIDNFFANISPDRPYHESDVFGKWKMRIYPYGKDGKETHLSLSLHLVSGDEPPNQTSSHIYAEFTLRLLNRRHHENWMVKETYWFSPTRTCFERLKLISMEHFKSQTAGFWSSSKDKCTIDGEVRVHGVTKPLQS